MPSALPLSSVLIRAFLSEAVARAYVRRDVPSVPLLTYALTHIIASRSRDRAAEACESGDDEVTFTEFLELTKKHQRPHKAQLFLSPSAQKYQNDRFAAKALPNFADPSSPASTAYLQRARARERIATRKAMQSSLPAAGSSSGFREYRLAERAAHEPLKRLLSSTTALTSPRGAAPSPRSAKQHVALSRPVWWG